MNRKTKNKKFYGILVFSIFIMFLIGNLNVVGQSNPKIGSEVNSLELNSTLISNDQVRKFFSDNEINSVEGIHFFEGQSIYQIQSSKSIATNSGDLSVELTLDVDSCTGDIIYSRSIIKINDQTVDEASNELLVVKNKQIKRILNLRYTDKNILREKACRLSVIPLISENLIKRPYDINEQKFAVQIKKDCTIDFYEYLLPKSTSEDYIFVIVKTSNLIKLLENPKVVKICDFENIPEFIEYLNGFFNSEANEMIRNLELKKTIDDVKPDLYTHFINDHWEVQPGQKSVYQQFITPNDVAIIELASTINSIKEAYEIANSWIWVSDSTLHGKDEKWLKPNEFLTKTPYYARNPVKGEIVSDCSEQANTFVSILRAIGVSAEDVRVVMGKVDFDGEIGGHAWVEIWIENGWMPIDVTSGNYYDDATNTLVSRKATSYDYWMYHPYPVVEVWAYYNDQYYVESGEDFSSKWAKGYDYESFIEATINAGLMVMESLNNSIFFISIIALTSIVIVKIKRHKKSYKK